MSEGGSSAYTEHGYILDEQCGDAGNGDSGSLFSGGLKRIDSEVEAQVISRSRDGSEALAQSPVRRSLSTVELNALDALGRWGKGAGINVLITGGDPSVVIGLESAVNQE